MVRKMADSIIQDFEKPMATLYQKRKKIASVDTSESPFVLERQLEDQRRMIENNKVLILIENNNYLIKVINYIFSESAIIFCNKIFKT